jgi:hypothetical protein
MTTTDSSPCDWSSDKPRLQAFLRAHFPYPAVFATLNGADLYGFPSHDDDYNLRASQVLPTRGILAAMLREGGMDRMPDLTVEAMVLEPAPEMDFVLHGRFSNSVPPRFRRRFLKAFKRTQ